MTPELASAALEKGNEQARRVLEFRQRARHNRGAALEKLAAAQPALRAVGNLRDASAGVLLAEGDSWFDYPFHDIVEMLEDDYAYDVESVAHKGDAVEEMAYSGGQLEELTRRLEKMIRKQTPPRAILLSGGGNDVVGDEFYMLLNHADSASPGINAQVMNGIVNERVAQAYICILRAVTKVCEDTLGHAIPILIHGYDYPVPDGRGYLGGWWLLPGPWMEPGFRRKGYTNLPQRMQLARELIDCLNQMLIGITAMAPFAHVRHVDLRGTLDTGPNYKNSWDNELHPTRAGFAEVTRKFVAALP